MLQNHGRADACQGPDHEEDSQAAANLLQVQKLKAGGGSEPNV